MRIELLVWCHMTYWFILTNLSQISSYTITNQTHFWPPLHLLGRELKKKKKKKHTMSLRAFVKLLRFFNFWSSVVILKKGHRQCFFKIYHIPLSLWPLPILYVKQSNTGAERSKTVQIPVTCTFPKVLCCPCTIICKMTLLTIFNNCP